MPMKGGDGMRNVEELLAKKQQLLKITRKLSKKASLQTEE
jgi:hypothetical protein